MLQMMGYGTERVRIGRGLGSLYVGGVGVVDFAPVRAVCVGIS